VLAIDYSCVVVVVVSYQDVVDLVSVQIFSSSLRFRVNLMWTAMCFGILKNVFVMRRFCIVQNSINFSPLVLMQLFAYFPMSRFFIEITSYDGCFCFLGLIQD